MDPVTASIIGGGALISGVGNILGQSGANETNIEIANNQNQWNKYHADRAMMYNTQETEKAREYSTYMSNTAYQRATDDMKAAGINPMAAFQQGGASSPGSPSASVGNQSAAMTAAMQNTIGPGLNSAMEILRTFADTKTALAGASQAESQAALNAVNAQKSVQETKTSGATAKNIESQTSLNLLKQNEAKTYNKIYKAADNIADKIEPVVSRITNDVNSAAKSIQNKSDWEDFASDWFN